MSVGGDWLALFGRLSTLQADDVVTSLELAYGEQLRLKALQNENAEQRRAALSGEERLAPHLAHVLDLQKDVRSLQVLYTRTLGRRRDCMRRIEHQEQLEVQLRTRLNQTLTTRRLQELAVGDLRAELDSVVQIPIPTVQPKVRAARLAVPCMDASTIHTETSTINWLA
ncbi:hypothetical protein BC831DRAFT_485411 [Entophlyctis helioformis]|nr:hypothetical protein BC831DRAFT_485411 [Entophlyctis helioformis]